MEMSLKEVKKENERLILFIKAALDKFHEYAILKDRSILSNFESNLSSSGRKISIEVEIIED